jgi:hypothetical protein
MFTAVAASVAALCGFSAPSFADPAPAGRSTTVVVATAPSPYWGYTYSPYGAYLQGAAAVTRANGDYLHKVQEAAMLREKVRQERLETRRKQLEQIEWERDFHFKSIERQRERVRQIEVEYSRNFPQLTEIYAAGPLNKLLEELVKQPALSPDGSAPVEAEWLQHVHVTSDGRTNLGLLKGDALFWPSVFYRPDFADDREAMDQLLTQAKGQILKGQPRVEPNLLADLRGRVAACQERCDREFRKMGWGPEDHYCQGEFTTIWGAF